MLTQNLYHIALIAHIIGLTMMTGATIVDTIIARQFWKQYAIDRGKAFAINQAMSKIIILFGAGILLLILSGVAMMYITHGVFGEQTWFRIKFALVIVVIVNGLAVGRRLGGKLRKLLSLEIAGGQAKESIEKIRVRLNRFYISQLLLFLVIFTLSVFKFN